MDIKVIAAEDCRISLTSACTPNPDQEGISGKCPCFYTGPVFTQVPCISCWFVLGMGRRRGLAPWLDVALAGLEVQFSPWGMLSFSVRCDSTLKYLTLQFPL